MGKAFVRFTVIFVAIYFLISFAVAQWIGFDILDYSYTLLFELITTIYCFSEGRYHCKYLKFTMLGILLADTITHLDYAFDLLSVTGHNLIPIFMLASGLATSTFLALRHFYRVFRIKRLNNGR